MPRKQRQPKSQIAALPPALHYLLMTGEFADTRIHGWVHVAQLADLEAACMDAWRLHGEALIAEAAAAGFEPTGLDHRRPTGKAVEQWRRTFLQAHSY